MDNSSSGTRRQDDDTPRSLSPPNVMSYATMAKEALSDERLDSAAGASPGAASRRREPRPTDNQTTVHSTVASRGRQATAEQFDVELDARSRAGKSPLDADNTQNVSAYSLSSANSSSMSAPKETRAAQREGITSSGTTLSESASSMQLPVHLPTKSPLSLDVLPSRALRDQSSNLSLSVVAPGPEETRKRNESPHPQEDSRSQRTVIRPHAVQVDRTVPVQAFVKPSISSPPPSLSSERRANTSYAVQVDRTASVQASATPPTFHPPPSSFSERRTNTPQAEQVARTAPVQPSAKPSIPSSPPFSSSEINVTRPHAEPVNRTASSSVQPSFKPSIPYPPPFLSNERNVTRPGAEPVNRTISVQPRAQPPAPSSPLDRPSASISPSLSPPTPALAKMASNRMHPPRETVSYESQAQLREPLSEPHPLVKKGNARPDEQARRDLLSVPRGPSASPDLTPATTQPPRQDRKDAAAVPQSPPVRPGHIHTTTDLTSAKPDRPRVRPEHTTGTKESPPLQDSKATSVPPFIPPVLPKHTTGTKESPPLQDPKNTSAAPFTPPVLPKHTSWMKESLLLQDLKGASAAPSRPPVLPDPPSNFLSQPVSGPGVLSGSKSVIQGNLNARVDHEAGRAMEGSPSVRGERLKDSANVKPDPTTSRMQDLLQYPSTPPEPLSRIDYWRPSRDKERDGSMDPITTSRPQHPPSPSSSPKLTSLPFCPPSPSVPPMPPMSLPPPPSPPLASPPPSFLPPRPSAGSYTHNHTGVFRNRMRNFFRDCCSICCGCGMCGASATRKGE